MCSGFIGISVSHANAVADGTYNCPSAGTYTVLNNVITDSSKTAGRFSTCAGALVIPDGITSIADTAFEESPINSLTIPSSVITIGEYAFFKATGLTTLSIGDHVTIIGRAAFAQTGLTSLTIPNSVTTIGRDAFYLVPLETLSIGDHVTTIEMSAFSYARITSLTIPISVTTIGADAFINTTNLLSFTHCGSADLTSSGLAGKTNNCVPYTNNCPTAGTYTVLNNVITNSSKISSASTCAGALVIPDGITAVAQVAFYGASSLTSLTIPNSVTTIGAGAFKDASMLGTLSIGDHVTTIGNAAFYGARSLTSLTIPNSVTTIGADAFDLTTNLSSFTYCGSVSLTSSGLAGKTKICAPIISSTSAMQAGNLYVMLNFTSDVIGVFYIWIQSSVAAAPTSNVVVKSKGLDPTAGGYSEAIVGANSGGGLLPGAGSYIAYVVVEGAGGLSAVSSIPFTIVPATVTLKKTSSTSTSATIGYTVEGNFGFDCLTLTSSDFVLTGIASISISQMTPTICAVSAISTATADGTPVISTLTASSTFAVTSFTGPIISTLTDSPQSITVTVADAFPPTDPTGLALVSASDSGASNSDGITKLTELTFSGLAEANSTVQLYVDGVATGSTCIATSGSFLCTSGTLLVGDRAITAKSTDSRSNTSLSSASIGITINQIAPTVVGFSSTTVSGTYAAGDEIEILATLSEAVIDSSSITVTLDTSATVLLTPYATGVLRGIYTIASGQKTADLTVSSFALTSAPSDTAGNAMSSVSVPGGAGNIADNSAIVIVDTGPTQTITSIDISADSGSSSTDFLTNTANQTITGTLSGVLGAGEKLWGSIDSGVTYTDITSSVSSTSISWSATLRTGTNSIKFQLRNALVGTTAIRLYTLDIGSASLTAISASNLTTGGATINFLPSKIGTYYYIVALAHGTFPSAATVIAHDTGYANGNGSTTTSTKQFGVTGLSASTRYFAYLVHVDVFGNTSPVSYLDFTTSNLADTTPPVLSAVSVSDVSETAAVFNYTPNEAGTYYYLLYLAATTAPTVDEVIGQTVTAILKGTNAISNISEINQISLTGLTGVTAYTAYLVVKDGAGNKSLLSTFPFTSGAVTDRTAPIIQLVGAGYQGLLATSVILRMSSNEAGEYSFVVKAHGAAAPLNVAEIADVNSAGALFTGGGVASASTNSISITRLIPSTSYDAYVFVRDAAANSSNIVGPINFTTSAATRVTGVTIGSSFADGSYTIDTDLYIQVSFSGSVNVVGTPQLALGLRDLSSALYYSGTGTVTLTFKYTVVAYDNSSDLDYRSTSALTLSALGSINNAAGDAVLLTLAAPAATGSISNTRAIIIDTTAPNDVIDLVLASSSDTGASNSDKLTKNTTLVFTGTAEVGATVQLYNGLVTTGDRCNVVSGAFSCTTGTISEGARNSITAKAFDAAGNTPVIPYTYIRVTIDTIAPSAPDSLALSSGSDTGSSSGDSLTKNTQLNIVLNAEHKSIVQLFDGGVATGATCTADYINFTCATGTLAAGEHVITATTTDLAGNTSLVSSSVTITIDTTAPSTPTSFVLSSSSDTGNSNSDQITSNTSYTFTGKNESNIPVRILVTGDNSDRGCTVSGVDFTCTIDILTAGVKTITVTSIDVAGNVSAGAELTVTIDRTAPHSQVSIVATKTNSNVLTVPYTASDSVGIYSVSAYYSTTENNFNPTYCGITVASSTSGNITCTLLTTNATYYIYTKATDIAGNVQSNFVVYGDTIYLDTVPPTVTGVTTTFYGTAKIGDQLTISITVSEAVVVTGTPQLTLETGTTDRTANYVSTINDNRLVFTYTVQAGDNSLNLDWVSSSSLGLNSGTIQDYALNDATLSLGDFHLVSLDTNNIIVDGVIPELSSATAESVAATSAVLNFTSSEVGTYYYLLLSASDATPTTATVEAQGSAIKKGSHSALAAANTVSLSGLTMSTSYKAHILLKDAAGNLSVVSTISFTTPALGDGPQACATGTYTIGSLIIVSQSSCTGAIVIPDAVTGISAGVFTASGVTSYSYCGSLISSFVGTGLEGVSNICGDVTAPQSSSAIVATHTTGNTVTLTYSATDAKALATLSLYYSTGPSLSSATNCSTSAILTTSVLGTLTCTIPAIDATYYFFTRATDAAGNTQSIPGSANDSIIRDTTAPVSSGSISATYTNGTSVSVAYSASDIGGLVSIAAFYSTNSDLTSPVSCGTVTSASTTGTISCTIPATDATYYIYTRATDVTGNIEGATVTSDDSIIRDTALPSLSATDATSLASTSVTLNFTSDKAGTYYYLIYSSSDTTPSSSVVEAQGTALKKGTSSALASANTIAVTGLSDSTSYKAHIIVKDAAGNLSSVSTISLVTLDITVPEVSSASADSLSVDGATIHFTSSEIGTYYFLLYVSTTGAPSATTIQAQGTAINKGLASTLAAANSVVLTGLSASTSYKAYVVVKDASGNVSSVTTISLTTSAVVTSGGGSGGGGGSASTPVVKVLLIPGITWNPAGLSAGEKLGSDQLNAIFSVPGVATYTPASGYKTTAGNLIIEVSFTPTDGLSYYNLITTRTVQVTELATPKATATPTPKATATPTPKATPSSTPTTKPSATPTPTSSPKEPTTLSASSLKLLGSVYFNSNEYFLDAKDRSDLTNIAKAIQVKKFDSVVVEGNTDRTKGLDNSSLSKARAQAVTKYLTSTSVLSKITTTWQSSSKTIVIATTPTELAKNRRVDIFGVTKVDPSQTPIPVIKETITKTYSPLTFNRNDYFLDAGDRSQLISYAKDMAKKSCLNIELVGTHDGSKGGLSDQIGDLRAKAVRSFLKNLSPGFKITLKPSVISTQRKVSISCKS